MIDWRALACSALWIFGLALLLAACSLANFWAWQRALTFRAALRLPLCRTMLQWGALFFSAGWACGASSALERGVWLAALLLLAAQILLTRFLWKP